MEPPFTVAPVADRKFDKFYAQVFEPACEAIGITNERFQNLMEQDNDAQVQARFEQFIRELNASIMESETIPVDYDEPNAILAAFEANDFGNKWVELDLATIQVAGKGKGSHKVFEWHPNRVLSNREIWPKNNLNKIKPGYKFADPLTALKYALKVPHRQFQHPLVILFELEGLLWYLDLDKDEDLRHVCITRAYFDNSWRNNVRFLLIRE